MRWTPEMDAQATREWQAGRSADEVARRLKVSRLAVLGRLARLGLMGGDSRGRRRPEPASYDAAQLRRLRRLAPFDLIARSALDWAKGSS